MKKRMVVFAVLILLLCVSAQAEGADHQFDEVWMAASALGDAAAYVLDNGGQLYRWRYDQVAPEALCALPVATGAMFQDWATPYPALPEDFKAQLSQTVNHLAQEGDTLYAVNQYAGRLGDITANGVQWRLGFDASGFLDEAGWGREVIRTLALDNRLYFLLNYWDEAPGPDTLWCSRILQLDTQSGATRLFDATEAFGMCVYKGGLLLLCGNQAGCYFTRFDPATLAFSPVDTPALEGQALAYDPQTDTILISTNEGVYGARDGGAFALMATLPSQYVHGAGLVTSSGRYAFMGGGVWVMTLSDVDDAQRFAVRLHSADPALKALFVRQYPDMLLDWRTDSAMTAADVAAAIRAGDTATAVFSVKVDDAFGGLVEKGFVAPLGEGALIDSVARMYPSLSAPLKNDRGEVVAYPWDISVLTWTVNPVLWQQYFGDAARPVTWLEFFQLMQRFELLDNANGDLFLMSWEYKAMLGQVLTSFIMRQETRGEAVDFENPLLAETLAELNRARRMLQERGVESYHEEEIFYDLEVVGGHSVFHDGLGASSHSSFLWDENALRPFVFAPEDAPVYAGGMRVLVVNPNAAQRELAEAFIALLTVPEYGVMSRYMLHSDAVEPYAQRPYAITAQAISAWQAAVSSIIIPTRSVLLSEAFLTQADALTERYAAGQLNEQMFLAKLNETAALVEREAQ